MTARTVRINKTRTLDHTQYRGVMSTRIHDEWSAKRLSPLSVTNGVLKRLSSQTPWSKMPRSNTCVPNHACLPSVNAT